MINCLWPSDLSPAGEVNNGTRSSPKSKSSFQVGAIVGSVVGSVVGVIVVLALVVFAGQRRRAAKHTTTSTTDYSAWNTDAASEHIKRFFHFMYLHSQILLCGILGFFCWVRGWRFQVKICTRTGSGRLPKKAKNRFTKTWPVLRHWCRASRICMICQEFDAAEWPCIIFLLFDRFKQAI